MKKKLDGSVTASNGTYPWSSVTVDQVIMVSVKHSKWWLQLIHHSQSHEPYWYNMVLIFYMPIPYHVALKIWLYTPPQGINDPCFIFSLANWNEWIHHWPSLWRINITWWPCLFLMNPKCFPRFVKFASTFWIASFCLCSDIFDFFSWAKCYNVDICQSSVFISPTGWEYEYFIAINSLPL